eukprot:gene7846-12319_t
MKIPVSTSCPCLNSGSCINENNGQFCECQKGWKGIFCEEKDNVISEQIPPHNCDCLNGICDQENICFCNVGYYGKKCELKKHVTKYNVRKVKHVQENSDFDLISVFVLHNHSIEKLRKTMFDLEKQSYPKYEVFILDYSKENIFAQKIRLKYSNKFITLKCKTNEMDALNIGLMLSNGKYSTILHSGDDLNTFYLANLLSSLKQSMKNILFIQYDLKPPNEIYELKNRKSMIFKTKLHRIFNHFHHSIDDFWLKVNYYLSLSIKTEKKRLMNSNSKNSLKTSSYHDMIRRKEITSKIKNLYVDSKTYLEINENDKRFKKIILYKGNAKKSSIVLLDSSSISQFKLPNRQQNDVCVVVIYRKELQEEIYKERFIFEQSVDLIFTKYLKTAQRLHLFYPNVFISASMKNILDTAYIHCNYQLYDRKLGESMKNLPFPQIKQLKENKLHIALQVDHFDFPGGLERVVLEVALQLRKVGIKLTLINCGRVGPPYKEMKKHGFKTYTLSSSDKIKEYRKMIKRENFSVINAHYSLFGAEMIYKLGIPFIQTIHNEYTWLNSIERQNYRNIDKYTSAYICVSSTVAMYSDLTLGLDVKKMIIVRNGVDTKRFNLKNCPSRESLLKEFNFSNDDFIFLQSGSLVPIKAPHFSIMAMKKVVEKNPKAKLILIGKGMDLNFPKKLNTMIKEYHLENHVKILGHRQDVPCMLNSIDVLLHPSLLEGWCLAIAEGIYMNKRVIITDTGGNQDVVLHYGVKGSIVMTPPYNSILTDDINSIANGNNPKYVERLANHMMELIDQKKPDISNRQKIRQKLSTKYIYRAYGHIFEWIHAKKSPETIKDLLRMNFW